MHVMDGVVCGTLFIEFINASLGTRVMPVAQGRASERDRERERESGYDTAVCVGVMLRAEVSTCGTPTYCTVQEAVITVQVQH